MIIDKPAGMTSHDVVARVRRVTGESSIGHLGTLDPMATGVLPLLLGKYTRLAQFYGAHEKAYTGSIRFGFATDTYDAEGQPTTEARPVSLSLDQVCAAAQPFLGELDQLPPPISAKKINGKPAYKIARAGETPRLKTARVTIREFVIESVQGELAAFRMRISAGGYVRSVAHELGQSLGTGAHLASLCRTASGPFLLADAISLDQLESLAREGTLSDRMPHPRALLPELPAVTADQASVGRLRNGMQINLPEFTGAPLVKIFLGQRELVGIGRRIAGTLFQPVVVLA
ncbi:tRNA pseudouridine55 synthase [Silvibacterium bohemicum]|uniref:tRNA pseudouridine synthase B n=1 Tax=Silvibacterium bohemicum TaxID=1577686 RepID=A0A841K3F1_9BACT|nr:tRNA pseudouridine(55) synthase TruB [Silvibacterium bohemicum]MBB6145158.1 tRNA pseudouridine55 synthase [Silvibacterium bohemicum]